MLPDDHGRGEVWLVWPVRARERVCSISDEVEFDKQARFMMYEVVIYASGVEIPFLAFELNVLQFLNVAPSQLHPEGWAWIRVLQCLGEYKGVWLSVRLFSAFSKWFGLLRMISRK